MIDSFEYVIDKYMLLDNESNKLAQICLDKIQNQKVVELITKSYASYGFVYLSVIDAQDLKLYYNDQVIATFDGSQNAFIPIVFEKNSQISIKGNCGKIKLVISGAGIKNMSKQYLLPSKNYIVKDNGNMCVYEYLSADDIVSGNLEAVKQIGNCMDVQLFSLNGCEYLICIANKNDSVYLYGINNNYTDDILIGADITDAKIVACNNDKLLVAYISDDKLFYKSFDNELNQFGESVEIVLTKNIVPKHFGQIQYDDSNTMGFLDVHYSDYSCRLFVYRGSEFVEKLTKKANFSKVIIGANNVVFLGMDGFEIEYSKYLLSSSTSDLTQDGNIENIYNVNDILKVGDKYFGIFNGEYSEIDL